MKAIEALTTFGNLWMGYSTVKETYPEHYETIEKYLKALEIIKEKNVDVFRLKKLDFNTFNQLQKSCKLPELTKEEFNLLKEVLKCQKE